MKILLNLLFFMSVTTVFCAQEQAEQFQQGNSGDPCASAKKMCDYYDKVLLNSEIERDECEAACEPLDAVGFICKKKKIEEFLANECEQIDDAGTQKICKEHEAFMEGYREMESTCRARRTFYDKRKKVLEKLQSFAKRYLAECERGWN